MAKKYLSLLFLSFPFLLLAQSPEKLIEKGEYDEAIEVCVTKLEKGKGNKAELYASLKTAYQAADNADNQKIIKLKSTQMPEIWYDVFTTYFGMQNRYQQILKIRGQMMEDQASMDLHDYSEDLEASRQNAVAFQYAYAQSLLKTGKQDDALQAYLELLKITKLVGEYKDVELLMRQSLGAGSKMALLEINNRTDVTLSPDFLSEIKNISLNYKERQFLNYTGKSEQGEKYPLLLSIDITKAAVTPGTVSEKEYTASHKNPESLDVAYSDETKKAEAKKHPEYNKCKIKEIYQIKTAVMEGTLKYIDGHSGMVLYVVPITARSVFENKTATAEGDLFACPPEVYKLLDKPKKKFPKNTEMLYNAGKEFKILIHSTVWNDAFIKD